MSRDAVKRLLRKYPRAFRLAQWTYHEVRYFIACIGLRFRHPSLELVRYSKAQLAQQRELGFRSQFGQDFFVWTRYFANTSRGVFLDVGCNQPELLNNTYYLEKHKGWVGLAFDPIARYEGDWAKSRKAKFLAVALGATNETKEFIEIHEADGWGSMLSGFAENARKEDLQYGHESYAVGVRRLSDILDELHIQAVDFMSVDVEGAELDVLSGLDLRRHAPKVILLENYRGVLGDAALRQHMLSSGYLFRARIWTTDDVYLRSDLCE